MPVNIPNFSTAAVITGTTLVSDADNQLNILMSDVKAYVENSYQSVATSLEGTVGIHVTSASTFAQASSDSADASALSALSASTSAQSASDSALSASGSADASALSALSASTSAQSASDSAYDASVNATTVLNHLNNTVNPHNVTAAQIGLGNVTNTSDLAKPTIGFTLTNTNVPEVGQVAWNQAEGTLDLGLVGATLQLGQEYLVRVRNNTTSIITNGTVIMVTGSIGNSGRVTVAPANVTASNTKQLLGITTEDIAVGADGFCTVFGKVRGINTTGSLYGETWQDGDVLYVKPSDNEALTNIEPSLSEVKLPIAVVIKAHSTGTLFVRVTPIDENHAESRIATKASLNQVIALALELGLTQGQIDTIIANNP